MAASQHSLHSFQVMHSPSTEQDVEKRPEEGAGGVPSSPEEGPESPTQGLSPGEHHPGSPPGMWWGALEVGGARNNPALLSPAPLLQMGWVQIRERLALQPGNAKLLGPSSHLPPKLPMLKPGLPLHLLPPCPRIPSSQRPALDMQVQAWPLFQRCPPSSHGPGLLGRLLALPQLSHPPAQHMSPRSALSVSPWSGSLS